MIKMKHLLGEIYENRNKPPKGYKIITPVVHKEQGTKFYDCQVWKDGRIILSTSMTMFESKDKAYQIRVRRAWDIHDGKSEWS